MRFFFQTLCLGTLVVALLPIGFASDASAASLANDTPANDWPRGAVVYQVFPRSFFDSNGDGIGDLRGILAKLDYLNDGNPEGGDDLGVDALWLMPFQPSPSYHGYDIIDFTGIRSEYGTLADFEALVRAAHARNMRIVMDLVLNHTSDRHPWFVDASSGKGAPHRHWYVWSDSPLEWLQPFEGGRHKTWHEKNGSYYYAAFFAGLPDLNYQDPAVRKRMKQVAKTWLNRGVDGFRLDGARYLIEVGPGAGQRDTAETHAFWKDFSAFVRRIKPSATLVGEAWLPPEGTDIIARYYGDGRRVRGGDELSMSFNFPLQSRIYEGLLRGSARAIGEKVMETVRAYPEGAIDAPLLDNHDMDRLATAFAENEAQLKAAAALLLTLPGAPFIYYGSEIGLPNGIPGKEDEGRRTPLPWSAEASAGFTSATPWYPLAAGWEKRNVETQRKDTASLFHWYRQLIQLRRTSQPLRKGDIAVLAEGVPEPLLVHVRSAGGQRVLTVVNVSLRAVTWRTPASLSLGEALLTSDAVRRKPDDTRPGTTLELPAYGVGVWAIAN